MKRANAKKTPNGTHIVARGKLAEICEEQLTKGKKVAIEGKLVHRTYETKDGDKRYVTEILCDELMML